MGAPRIIDGRYDLGSVPFVRGGMGEVWVGRDTTLDRDVAVKFVRLPDDEDDDELLRRFARESRITAGLHHPGVPAVYDVGTHDGLPYLVMQRIRGISLADLVAERGALPVGWAAGIAAQVCAVLAAAHQASLVHRDLKPANLMLEPDGTVKVLDFGLAVALENADMSRITRTGQSIGTPAYMAPEQVMAGLTGPRADLYALGCVLYEMLTGRQPFGGPTVYSVMSQQVDQPPAAPRGQRPDLPADLDALVLWLLRKNPQDRPADAVAVYRRLLPHAVGLGALPGVLHPPRVPNPARMYAGAVGRVFDEQAPAPAGHAAAAAGHTVAAAGHTVEPAAPATGAAAAATSPAAPAAGTAGAATSTAEAAAGVAAPAAGTVETAEVTGAAAPAAEAVADLGDPAEVAELADQLFDNCEFDRAGTLYRRLAERPGGAADERYAYRQRQATCHALAGRTSRALEQLTALLDGERRAYGDTDDRVLELRRQIGLLQLGAGRREAAEATLGGLLTDLTAMPGTEHPSAAQVRDLLTSLHTTNGPG